MLARVLTREVFTALIIILVGSAGFGLGKLSVSEREKTPLVIENDVSDIEFEGEVKGTETSADAASVEGGYVASKNGSKYYYPWCSGADRILEANKVWFKTVEDAVKAGFSPAANCKGLK